MNVINEENIIIEDANIIDEDVNIINEDVNIINEDVKLSMKLKFSLICRCEYTICFYFEYFHLNSLDKNFLKL